MHEVLRYLTYWALLFPINVFIRALRLKEKTISDSSEMSHWGCIVIECSTRTNKMFFMTVSLHQIQKSRYCASFVISNCNLARNTDIWKPWDLCDFAVQALGTSSCPKFQILDVWTKISCSYINQSEIFMLYAHMSLKMNQNKRVIRKVRVEF